MTRAPVTLCPACGQSTPKGAAVQALRDQLREAKLGLRQREGEIERLRAMLAERCGSLTHNDPGRVAYQDALGLADWINTREIVRLTLRHDDRGAA